MPRGSIFSVLFNAGDSGSWTRASCTDGSISLGRLDLGPHCQCGLTEATLTITPQLGLIGVFATALPEQDGVVTLPVVFDLATMAVRD